MDAHGGGFLCEYSLSSSLNFPIVVENANRAPQISNIDSITVARGQVLDIPVTVLDSDNNDVDLAWSGLPPFAVFTHQRTEQTEQGKLLHGFIRLAPQQGDKGSYTVVLTATDNGDGDHSARLSHSSRFTVTVKNETEAPVITLPEHISAVAGELLSIPVWVTDADQDTLHYVVQGLPEGAKLIEESRYGHARIEWTPSHAQLGVHHLNVVVQDSGMPSENEGYVINPTRPLVANTAISNLQITVHEKNLAPEIISVRAVSLAGSLIYSPPVGAES